MKTIPYKLILSILICFSVTGILVMAMPIHVEAQTTGQDWSAPVNLSQSGGANDPAFVIDADGFLHVLWRDTHIGTLTTNVGGEWSQPIAGDFPFDTYLPKLLADNAGNIHAFWINDRGELIYSRTTAANFGITNAWSGSTTLSDSAANFTAMVDELGTIHLAYVRTLENERTTDPAGVYYTQSTNNGTSWTSANLLYQSPYLRSLTQDSANINMSSALQTDETMSIYIVWDNLPLRRVYLIKSSDDGQTWEPTLEVDGPHNTFGLSAPYDLEIAAKDKNVVLVWLVGQKGVSCSQYSKYTDDGGQNWSESQKIFGQLTAGGCPQDNQMIGYTDSYATLMSNTQGQIFLAAWDGSNWSDPQLQSVMGGFVDPNTLASVSLSCHNLAIRDNQLFVIGCDHGAGSDIWFLNRSLGEITNWFPPPSTWKVPTAITSSEYEFQSLQTVADDAGEVHALWMQPTGIYYTYWSDGQWLLPTAIIKSTFNDTDQFVATTDQAGLIYLVWTSNETGEILFSWANSSKATDAKEWASPRVIPSPQVGGQSPDLVVNASGSVFVIYSIPINEDRGVYLVSSADRGETWSKPMPIFDAVSAGWEMVNQSRVSLVGEDHLVATWADTSLNKGPIGLFFSGFSANTEKPEASIIVSKPVIWNDISGFGENTIHRVWQELDKDQPEIWHTYSNDQGQTWEQSVYISSIGEIPGPSDITLDRSGQLHLTYTYIRDEAYLGIKHWIWNGENWSSDQGIDLGEIEQRGIGAIASTISSNGEIFTVFSLSQEGADYELMFTHRYLETPSEISGPGSGSQTNPEPSIIEENAGQKSTPTVEATAEVEITPSATQNPEVAQPSNQPAQPTDSIMGLVLGIGLAFALVAVAFIVRLLIASRKQ